ncbi:hypothetical protein ACH4S8_05260 [Streptomyces sp. NPDC021080]|uniref:hypothetical protein n=1 Tax=Streptomyces sp. NPDC021080 TaxID=3365110 RepID=UPI00379B61CC
MADRLQQLAENEKSGTGIPLVTHDRGVAADRAQCLVVTARGRVRRAPRGGLSARPRHEYSRGLPAAIPGRRVLSTSTVTSTATATITSRRAGVT